MTTVRTLAKVVPEGGLFTFLWSRDVSHVSGRQCSMACSVWQRSASWWRVPTFQFSGWSGIEVDPDDRVIVWSESDMTAAFCCSLLEPSWYFSWQLTRRFLEAWLRNLTPHWQMSLECNQLCGSCLWVGRAPAVCSNIFIDGCVFCHRPWEQDWTPAGKYGATCHCHIRLDKSHQDVFTVYFDGFSQAELVHISELAEVPAEVPSATAAVHAAWTNWGIPRKLGNEGLSREDEIEVLGARMVREPQAAFLSHEQRLASSLLCRRGFCQGEPRIHRASANRWRTLGLELSNSPESFHPF